MNDSFSNFSSNDYVNGACQTLENANKHFKTAEISSSENMFGIAISHLILASEEFIKSFILLCLSGEEQFISDEDKVQLFRNHKFKHTHISLFLKAISNTAVKKFDEELFNRLVHNQAPESNYSLNGFYINKVFELVDLSDEKLQELETWLRKANELKNNGFYIGVQNDWITPNLFTENDYKKALELMSLLKNAIEPLFEFPLTDEDFIDYLNGY